MNISHRNQRVEHFIRTSHRRSHKHFGFDLVKSFYNKQKKTFATLTSFSSTEWQCDSAGWDVCGSSLRIAHSPWREADNFNIAFCSKRLNKRMNEKRSVEHTEKQTLAYVASPLEETSEYYKSCVCVCVCDIFWNIHRNASWLVSMVSLWETETSSVHIK